MMTQAFYTGLSGLKSNQYALDVVSDNLANTSTVGFRGSEYGFSSLFGEMLNTASDTIDNTVGIGSRIHSTPIMQKQGSLLLSEKSTDLAIVGDGWFGIQGTNEPVYTRDGSFTFDANDDLVSVDGYHVLGTMGGNISNGILNAVLDEVEFNAVDAQEKLQFPKELNYPPEPTTNAKFTGNLGYDDIAIVTMGATVIDPENNNNNLRLAFSKVDPQVLPGSQWNVTATTKSLDGITTYDTQSGIVEFSDSGALLSNSLTSIDNNGAPVTIDLGTGYSGVITLDNADVVSSSVTDGTQGGELQGYTINQNAEVVASFSNGKQSSVGKIAVYHFQNDQGLDRLNGSKFQESSNSGEAFFYQDETGKYIAGSQVLSSKLEASNIDLSYGITELIILQRSFDANSKSVTTAHEMMQKALEMDA